MSQEIGKMSCELEATKRRTETSKHEARKRGDYTTNSFLSKIIITTVLVLASICSIQGSQHNNIHNANSNKQYNTQQEDRNNHAVQSILLDTTEQSSLGWTKYPDGERAASRSPGWVEESFVNFEQNINWRSFVVCDVAFNSVNNWLWTPFIERGDASRLYIEIKFTMRDCNLFPQMVLSCKETFALLYKEVDAPISGHSSSTSSNSSFAQSDSYTLIDAIAADEGRFTSNNDVVINTEVRSIPVTKRGVYFAFRDQGACLSLISIRVYSLRCPQQVSNFARFNATSTGRELTSLVAVEGECVAGAMQLSEVPRQFCAADGQWQTMASGQCRCLAGHEPSPNATKCQPCAPGRFKWQLGEAQCQPCPERSYAPTAGSSECRCHEGFYRSPRDPRWLACSQPPAEGPSNLSATYLDSSLLVLQWQAPRLAAHNARSDLQYRVVCDSCSMDEQPLVSSPSMLSNFSETRIVLAGLQPGQSYRFTVAALNGVSPMSPNPPATSEIVIQTPPKTSTAPEVGQTNAFNLRALPGARGTDMLLAWDSAPAQGEPQEPPEAVVYEIRYQPLEGPVARRSPYALLSAGEQPSPAHAGSLTTTQRAAGLYGLQPRTEYSFQVRAKPSGAAGSPWTEWSEPVLASTGAATAVVPPTLAAANAPFAPASLAPQFLGDTTAGFLAGGGLEPRLMMQPPSPPFVRPHEPSSTQHGATNQWSILLGTMGLLSLAGMVLLLLLRRHRKSLFPLRPHFASAFQPHSNGSSSSTYGSSPGATAALYGNTSGLRQQDLLGPHPFGAGSTITTTSNGNHLIYHNAAMAHQYGLFTGQQQQQHHHHHQTLGSAGALLQPRQTSGGGPTSVVQSFLASTLGHLTGQKNHHQQQQTIQQQQKLFINQNNGGQNNNLNSSTNSPLVQHHQQVVGQPRNHYQQMLGNVNHTLLFGQHMQVNSQQQQLANSQQDFYSNRQRLPGQQQQYGALEAALNSSASGRPAATGRQHPQQQQQQQHIYDDLDVVSQSATGSLQSAPSPASRQQQPLVVASEEQNQQSALSMMMARELFDAQQQQQAISLGNVIGARRDL